MKGRMGFGGGGQTNGTNGFIGRAATGQGATGRGEGKIGRGDGKGFTGEVGFWALEFEDEDGVEYYMS